MRAIKLGLPFCDKHPVGQKSKMLTGRFPIFIRFMEERQSPFLKGGVAVSMLDKEEGCRRPIFSN
ncbi:MAG: hypothetical protein A2506_13410 [Elusimicrobia bacterium RIFOXYD12_FULL_66_9]|nr:MAG: hypothetical protein A2506_13410 [Elusimicrobia bacterium RIFOXYD12_FULL_66_9]